MASIPLNENILHKTIVIHPGSLWLRIGRATDVQPLRLLHAIARHRLPGGRAHRDSFLPPIRCHRRPRSAAAIEDRLLEHRTVLRRLAGSVPDEPHRPEHVAEHNRLAEWRVGQPASSRDAYTSGCNGEAVIISDDILNTDPETLGRLYNVHFPMQRGELNLHRGVGGSRQSIITDMHLIWLYALCKHYHIEHDQLRSYRAVLIIPDTFDRRDLRELMTLLLSENHGLGFASAFLVQDHVVATYGADLPCACVVDVGDQKVSVSCVDGSLSSEASRVRFAYGMADVAQVHRWLLRDAGLDERILGPLGGPTHDVVLAMRVRQLASDWLHLDCERFGVQQQTVRVDGRRPGDQHTECDVLVCDASVLAALALFDGALLAVTGVGRQSIRLQVNASRQPDAEDCFDADYLREISYKHGCDWLECEDVEKPEANILQLERDVIGETIADVNVDEYRDQRGQCVGLSQAVVTSIRRCSGNDEQLEQRLFGNVLLVGGGAQMVGLAEWLRRDLAKTAGRQVKVSVGSRNGGLTETTAWLGATIMAGLASADELFVSGDEWRKGGVRVLRERAPFVW